MNKVVCFDLDDTVFNFLSAFIPYMQKYAPARLTKEEISGGASKWKNWEGYQFFGLTTEEFKSIFKSFWQKGNIRNLVSYNKDMLKHHMNDLKVAGWSIVFVTRRPTEVIWQSVGALRDDQGIVFDTLYHINPRGGSLVYDYNKDSVEPYAGTRKYDVFKELGAMAVFDDHPEFILEAVEAGVPYLYFVNRCHNESWRKKSSWQYPQIKYVERSWDFLAKEIRELVKV